MEHFRQRRVFKIKKKKIDREILAGRKEMFGS